MAFSWRRANPLGALKLLRSHRELFGLASVNFLSMLAHAVLPIISVLYLFYRYGWDERAVGFVLAAVGITAMVVQGALIGPAIKRFGERTSLIGGLAVRRRGIFRLRRSHWIPRAVLRRHSAAGAVGSREPGLARADEPPCRRRRAGQLQGANASIQGIASMLGPGIFSLTFAYAIRPEPGFQLPGAPFLLAATVAARRDGGRVAGHAGRQIDSVMRISSRDNYTACRSRCSPAGRDRRSSRRSSPACRASSGLRPASRSRACGCGSGPD